MRRLLFCLSILTVVTGLGLSLIQNPPYSSIPAEAHLDSSPSLNSSPNLIPHLNSPAPDVAPPTSWVPPDQSQSEPKSQFYQSESEGQTLVRMYKFPPGNPTLSLTAQDPLAVLESPPAELLRGEPHVIPDYPNHQAIHMPIIPALSLGNLEFLLGMFVYESPALANCIDRSCFCPMVYDPVCTFNPKSHGLRPSDRGYRIFSNSCSFKCAQTCDPQIQFAYCGECNDDNELDRSSLECLKEVFEPPSTPKPVYIEPVVLRRTSFLQQ